MTDTSFYAATRHAMLLIWLMTVAVIYYGSLYPFELRPIENPGQAIAYLLGTTEQWDRPGDLISNILLYIPCGLFGMLALKSRVSALTAITVASLAGVLISASVEFTQFYAEYRNPTFGDIYANAIGSLIGALSGMLGNQYFRPAWFGPLAQHPRASLLLTLWLGARLYPYAPTIDLHKYWHALKPLVVSPSLPLNELFHYGVMWLLIAALLYSCYGLQRWKLIFPLFAFGFFSAKVLITDNVVKPSDLLGSIAAYLLWLSLLTRTQSRYLLVALPFFCLLLTITLAPYSFSDIPWRDYGWIPFKSLMQGSIGVNVQSFCEKAALYGGMIWLLARSGFSFTAATLCTASVLLITSYLQTYLPARSAEITDVVICLMIGIVFAILPKPVHRTRHE